MDELERRISNLALPKVPPSLDAKIEAVLSESGNREDVGIVSNSIRVSQQIKHWSTSMSLKVGSLAAALLLITALASVAIIETTIAFGDVVESARSVRTIQYVFKRIYFAELPTGSIPVQSRKTGEFEMRSDIHKVVEEAAEFFEERLKNATTQKERDDLKARIELLRDYTAPEAPLLELAVRVQSAVGGLERRESIFPLSSDSVTNPKSGKQVAFDNIRKKRLLIKTFSQDSRKSEPKLLERMQDDVISYLISIPERDVTALGTKSIDEKPVVGFRQAYEMNGGEVRKDFWIDPATKLPVHIEERFFEKDSDSPSSYGLYSNFVYNEPLDGSLFSTDPPEGFETEEVRTVFLSDDFESDDEESTQDAN